MQKKHQTIAEAEVEKEKLNVDMYALNNDRVNDLYFEFSCWTSKSNRIHCYKMDFRKEIIVRLPAYVENGIANQALVWMQ